MGLILARLLPFKYIALAVVLVALGVFVWRWDDGRLADAFARGYAKGHAEWVALDAEMNRRAALAEAAARVEEARRAAAQQEIENAHQAAVQQARADAAIADAAAGRLRQRVAALIAATRSGHATADPAATPGGPAADDPAGMLADVFGRCVARVEFLARIADERGAAGTACQQSYESLSQPPPVTPQAIGDSL